MGTRADIIANIDTLLKTITVVNGYQTNIGASVEESRLYPVDPDALPAVVYRDAGVEAEGRDNFYALRKLSLEIGVFVSGSTVFSDIRKIIQDVLKALGKDVTLGKKCYDMEYEGDSIKAEEQNEVSAEVLMRVAIYYQSKLWED